jgi:hypothetical protein
LICANAAQVYLKKTLGWKMLDHEREPLARVKPEKLLRQIEESLAHSRELIAKIEDVRRNRSARLAQEAEGAGGRLAMNSTRAGVNHNLAN